MDHLRKSTSGVKSSQTQARHEGNSPGSEIPVQHTPADSSPFVRVRGMHMYIYKHVIYKPESCSIFQTGKRPKHCIEGIRYVNSMAELLPNFRESMAELSSCGKH